MSDDYYDDEHDPEVRVDDATAELAEARGRETVRNRMIELWRTAVDCAAQVEQTRATCEQAAPAPVPRSSTN